MNSPTTVREHGQRNAGSSLVDNAETIEQDRLQFERHFDNQRITAGWRELLLAAASLAAWFFLFAGGTLINTAPYISTVATPSALTDLVTNGAMIILFWTITNIGTLSVIAAVLGAFGQRTRFATRDHSTPQISTDGNQREFYIHYASAVMRGFGVYVLFLSGLLVLATEALVKPDQGEYVRLAGVISVVSFYAGYDPDMLAGLLERIKKVIATQ